MKEKIHKTNATRHLDDLSIPYELIPYTVDEEDLSAQHVATSLNENIDQVYKTLVLRGERTGLHFADIDKLLHVLHGLADKGNTVLIIEHNLDVIKTADWLIDLGPEGGDKGGQIVCEGTPREVAACPQSYTGKYLKPELDAVDQFLAEHPDKQLHTPKEDKKKSSPGKASAKKPALAK